MWGTDKKTDKYLNRVAANAGFIYRNYTEQTTEEVFDEANVPLYSCGTVKIGEHGIARIHNFPAETRKFNERLEFTNNDDDTEFHYAVGLPTVVDHDRTHITLLFDEVPDKSDIKTAWLLSRVKRAIEYGNLTQHFSCRVCAQRKHWTDADVDIERLSSEFREKVNLCQHQVCSPTDLEKLRTSGTIEEDNETAEEADPEIKDFKQAAAGPPKSSR